jgi:DNA-binding XRE family transcriptional regulator
MPRKPTKHSNYRAIRNILRFSQSLMASHLGVSKHTIVKIENKQMPVPPGLAFSYHLLTGCDIIKDEATKTWEVVPTRLGAPFTLDMFVSSQSCKYDLARSYSHSVAILEAIAGAAKAGDEKARAQLIKICAMLSVEGRKLALQPK